MPRVLQGLNTALRNLGEGHIHFPNWTHEKIKHMKINSFFDPILILIEKLGINNFEIKNKDNIITYKSIGNKNNVKYYLFFG